MSKTRYVIDELSWRNAYHIAGRAASTFYTASESDSPCAGFHIAITPTHSLAALNGGNSFSQHKLVASIEGGCLNERFPLASQQAGLVTLPANNETYLRNIETSIVNSLVGPLAEAKYVALRDDEVFNANLVYLGALKFYNGDAAMRAVDEYLDSFAYDVKECRKKSADLFLAAYSFVNSNPRWEAISQLADFIHQQKQGAISYQAIAAILEVHYMAPVSEVSPVSVRASQR